jgi:Right handed beta helix region
MKRLLILVAVAWVVAFASGAQPALGYDDGPSASIDPGQFITYPTALAGLGDTLPTFDPTSVAVAGIPDTAVGIDSAPAIALPDPPPGTTLIVDDDDMQCPNATFTTINQAVAAALPGDTIKVCPGIYRENVVVDKPQLTFVGQTQASDGRCAKPTEDRTHDSIVQYPYAPGTGANGGSAGFSVQASGVVIDGFIVEPLTGTGGPTQDGDGVYSSKDVSGTVVENSIIQHNARGIHLFSNGLTQTIVRMNCIRDNNLGPSDTLTGQGIYLDIDFSNGLIEHNFTTLNSSAAMNLYIASDVTIQYNKSLADSSAVAIFASSLDTPKGPIEVFYNLATQATGSTFFIGGANDNVQIIDNDLRNGAFSGIRFSDLTFVGPLLAPSANLEVRGNQIQAMDSSGIRAGGQSAASAALVDSTLAGNNSHDNVVDGIRIEAGANGGNTITLNTLMHNGEHDCHDDTVGPGTGGTLNNWTNNEGKTENRPNLCKHASTT